jgi:hypothetical protein
VQIESVVRRTLPQDFLLSDPKTDVCCTVDVLISCAKVLHEAQRNCHTLANADTRVVLPVVEGKVVDPMAPPKVAPTNSHFVMNIAIDFASRVPTKEAIFNPDVPSYREMWMRRYAVFTGQWLVIYISKAAFGRGASRLPRPAWSPTTDDGMRRACTDVCAHACRPPPPPPPVPPCARSSILLFTRYSFLVFLFTPIFVAPSPRALAR